MAGYLHAYWLSEAFKQYIHYRFEIRGGSDITAYDFVSTFDPKDCLKPEFDSLLEALELSENNY